MKQRTNTKHLVLNLDQEAIMNRINVVLDRSTYYSSTVSKNLNRINKVNGIATLLCILSVKVVTLLYVIFRSNVLSKLFSVSIHIH